jgi:SnoaL-like domain
MQKSSRRKLLLLGMGSFGTLATTQVSVKASSQKQHIMNESVVQQVRDRQEIIDTINRIGLTADFRDWSACQACFAESVEVDYTSLMGGEPNIISSDTLTKQWQLFFDRTFKTTQHLIGSHSVTPSGNSATCLSQFQAHHVLINPTEERTWTLGGFYVHELVRTIDVWRVHKMKMTWTWEAGSRPFA